MQVLIVQGFYQIFSQTSSVAQTGLWGLVFFVPTVLLTLAAGKWVDTRHSARPLFPLIQGLLLILSLLLVVGSSSLAVLFTVSFAMACLRAIRGPVFYALFGTLKRQGLSSSNVVRGLALSWQLPLVIGPVLFSLLTLHITGFRGEVLIAVSSALGFLFSLPAQFVREPEREDEHQNDKISSCLSSPDPRSRLSKRGLGLAASTTGPFVVEAAVMFLLAFTSLLPALLVKIGAPPESLGYLRGAVQAGGLLTAALLPATVYQSSRRGAFALALIGLSLVTAGLAFVDSLPGLITVCAVFGLVDGWSSLYRDSLLMELSSRLTLGRLAGLNQILVSVSDDLGETRAGFLAEAFGVRPALILGSAVAAIVSVVYGLRSLRIQNRLSLSMVQTTQSTKEIV